MLATSKNVLFPGYNHLLTTGVHDPTLIIARAPIYSPIDPQINPLLYLDMTYPPAKFDVDWSQETQVTVKKNKLMFDARPPTRPLTSPI